MYVQEIIAYLERASRQGLDPETIKYNLIKLGCSEDEIQKGFNLFFKDGLPASVEQTVSPSPPPAPPPVMTPLPPLPPPTKEEEPTPLPLISSRYYQKVLSGQVQPRIFLLILLLAIFNAIKPSYLLFKYAYPIVDKLETHLKAAVDQIFPAELEITIKQGQVAVNVPEPYYLTLPKDTLNLLLPEEQQVSAPLSKIRLLAIDTRGKAEDFERYQAQALLTANSLVYYNEGKINITSLRNIQNLTVNKAFIDQKYQEINPDNRLEKLLKTVILSAPLIIVVAYVLGIGLSLLLLNNAIWLILKIKQVPVRYGRSYIYTATVAFIPLLLSCFLALTLPFSPLNSFEALSPLVIIALAYVFIHQRQKEAVYV